MKILISKRTDVVLKKSIKRMRRCFSVKCEPEWYEIESNLTPDLDMQIKDLPVIKKISDNFKKEIKDLLESVNLYKATLSYLDNYRLKKEYLRVLINSKDLDKTKIDELKIRIVS